MGEASLHVDYGDGESLDDKLAELTDELAELQLRNVPPGLVLPERLLELPRLRTLGMSGKDDKLVIPALVERLPVVELKLWDCHASDVPVLPTLRHLWIVLADPAAEVPILAERFPQLTELDIWGSHLESGELPDAIARFSELATLELVSCGLRTLPEALAELPALRTLVVRGCPMTQFPVVLTRMPRLAALELRAHLAGLPPAMRDMTGLRTLDLGHALNKGAMLSSFDDTSKLKPLPRVLGELERLERLVLDCCGVVEVSALRTLVNLRALSLQWAAITSVDDIAELGELEELSLEHCDRVRDLAPLARCAKLRVLNLSHTEPRSLDVIRDLPALRQLNIEGIEAKRIDAIFERELELTAGDEVLERYAARAKLRALPPIDRIVGDLAADSASVVEAALDHLATWAVASSTRDHNAILAAFGIAPAHVEEEDEGDDDDDFDDDDDESDEDDDDDELPDEGDDAQQTRALPALDRALTRQLGAIAPAVLAKLFGALFHTTRDDFIAARRVAHELARRGDDAAQLAMIDAFIAACEHYDAGHREGGRVHDALIDDVFPRLRPPALAKLLAWAGDGHLEENHGDDLFALFRPALREARDADRATLLERLERFVAEDPKRLERRLAAVSTGVRVVDAEIAAIGERLAERGARAKRMEALVAGLESENTKKVSNALAESAALPDEQIRDVQRGLWDANKVEKLDPAARRRLLALWQRVRHDRGLACAIAGLARWLDADALRADVDTLAGDRGKVVRAAILEGRDEQLPAPRLDMLRALAASYDHLSPAAAASAEVRGMIAQAEYDAEKLLAAMQVLAELDAYEPGDGDELDEFPSVVAMLAESQEWEPLRLLARHLHKLQLTGRALERILAQLVAVCMMSGDTEALAALMPIVPSEVTWDILAFNLACKAARDGCRDDTFRFTRRALELGKSPDQFLSDSDFSAFHDDAEFVALLDEHR
jgi:Leucine-rich repeat (LRR) protein